jgi:hypothetical protein
MPLVNEDIPQTGGPNASLPLGEATQSARLAQELASTGRSPQGGAPLPPSPPAPTAPGAPPSPAQPAPAAPGAAPELGASRLDMNAIFPPMPELQQSAPWRQQIRDFAAHPQANLAVRRLGAEIGGQRGPLG